MKGTNKGKRLSMLAAGALIIGMALTAGLVGCDNGAVDATITGYGLPGAAGPAELTFRQATAGYDFGSSKLGSITLTVSTSYTSQTTSGGATTTGYTATGTFTDSFGVPYTASGYFGSGYAPSSSGYAYFYGTIGGKTNSGVYVSWTGATYTAATGTASSSYTLTDTSVSGVYVLEPAASIYIVSYKKAALDASHQLGYRMVGTNTFTTNIPTSAGFAYTTVYGYPVTDALVTDDAAGDKAKAFDPDLVTYILSVNDFLNGTAAGVPDAFETKEFQFGFQNTQVNHDPSYTWIEQTVRRAAQ